MPDVDKNVRVLIGSIVILAFCAGISLAVYSFLNKPEPGCSEEARMCPDGSVVTRQRPSCEFTLCAPTTEVTFTQLYKQENSGDKPDVKENKVIRLKSEYDALVKSLGIKNLPVVNFTNEMVLYVAQGRQNSGGHSIQVEKLIETDKALIVFIKEIKPGPSCITTTAITAPYQMVKTSLSAKEIDFRVTEEETNCN